MEEIVTILMDRDGMSKQEALDILADCRAAFEEAEFDNFRCEELFEDFIGLEPDYMIDFLMDMI